MIDKIFNGAVDLPTLGVYIFWGIIGMLLSLAVQQYKAYPKIDREGGWRVSTFLLNNFNRFSVVILVIIVAAGFSELAKTMLGFPMSNWWSFTAGFATDRIVDAKINRKK